MTARPGIVKSLALDDGHGPVVGPECSAVCG